MFFVTGKMLHCVGEEQWGDQDKPLGEKNKEYCGKNVGVMELEGLVGDPTKEEIQRGL